jgi:hypothetical protein
MLSWNRVFDLNYAIWYSAVDVVDDIVEAMVFILGGDTVKDCAMLIIAMQTKCKSEVSVEVWYD